MVAITAQTSDSNLVTPTSVTNLALIRDKTPIILAENAPDKFTSILNSSELSIKNSSSANQAILTRCGSGGCKNLFQIIRRKADNSQIKPYIGELVIGNKIINFTILINTNDKTANFVTQETGSPCIFEKKNVPIGKILINTNKKAPLEKSILIEGKTILEILKIEGIKKSAPETA